MEKTIHIDNLQKINGKPVLEIPEHKELHFIENQKDFFVLTETDISKQEELEKKRISLIETPTGILVSTNYYVGVREFSKFILKVIPKQVGEIESLGRMIAFCYMDKEFLFKEENIRFQKELGGPLEWLIIAFTQLCQELIKKGLYKKYVTYTDNVPYLKGKLLIKQQIQNTMKFNMKFHCEYDEFTSNNLENQIILHTLKKCMIISKNGDLTTKIQKLIHHMDKQIEDKQITLLDFRKIHYTRLNKNYESPLDLSKLILEKTGFMNIKEMKTEFIIPFFINMPELFEKFLEKLFKIYSELNVKPQYETTPWKKNDTIEEIDEMKMRPDLVVYEDKLEDSSGNTIHKNIRFVIDAKYMEDLKLSERYQIAFYLHEYSIKNGFAICPTLEKTFQENNGQITYEDNQKYSLKVENQGISIDVRHINVNQFLDIIYSNKPKIEIQKLLGNLVQILN